MRGTFKQCRYPGREAGLSLLEFALLVIIVGLLMVIAMEKILRLEVDVERVNLERVIGSLRSALAVEFARRVVDQRLATLAELQGANPMDYLQMRPDNYLGVHARPTPHSLPKGSWYYDSAEQSLVYLVKNTPYFETALEGPARARFELTLVFADMNRNGRFDAGVDAIEGVNIRARERYRWRGEPRE